MIDYNEISRRQVRGHRLEEINRQFKETEYVSISDALVNLNRGGQEVIEMLAKEWNEGRVNPRTGNIDRNYQREWKLKVLCDQWGLPVKPGTIIKHKVNSTNKHWATGAKLTSRDIKEIQRRGDGDKLVTYHASVVDDEGCITVQFEDASKLLNIHGIYYKSNQPISRLKEKQRAVRKAPDGEMRQIHNWRYVEVLPTPKKEKVAEQATQQSRVR